MNREEYKAANSELFDAAQTMLVWLRGLHPADRPLAKFNRLEAAINGVREIHQMPLALLGCPSSGGGETEDVWTLSTEASVAFAKALIDPPEPNEALKQAMARLDNLRHAYHVYALADGADFAYRDVPGSTKTLREDLRLVLSTILCALKPNPPSPSGETGWRLVPVEPTREMWAAMGNALVGYKQRHHDIVAARLWKAVLAAAPTSASQEGGE